ncbi:hypothetical protein SCUCBS95973_001040 [Sporothrix curviconia]|uniref:Peroxin 20 n=1 Tax=Sporothrix curviconia TaxID=1260050 RepID=A0ABP0AV60_9PEZI
MADNMCGPSTALKSFSEHVNRDRSVHQDRAAPGRAGPANFRSTPMGSYRNEADVRAFTSQAAFQAEPMGMVPDMNGHMHPAAFQQMGPQMSGPQARFAGPDAVPGHANSINSNNWAAEFAAGPGLMPSAASAAAAPQAHQAFGHQPPLQAVNQRLQHFSSGMMAPAPAFVSMAQPGFANHTMYNGYASATSSYMPPASATATATAVPPVQESAVRAGDAPSGVAGLTEAELEARFAQMESELDFQGEMDSWMQAHGPSAAEQAAVSAPTEDVDAILESLADDLDAQRLAESTTTTTAPLVAEPTEEEKAQEAERRDQDDLARTAGQIIDTLDGHPNARFQESSFMRLMRRIHTREVTVKGDNLVDETTGLPIDGGVQETTTTTTTTTTATTPSSGDAPALETQNQGAA